MALPRTVDGSPSTTTSERSGDFMGTCLAGCFPRLVPTKDSQPGAVLVRRCYAQPYPSPPVFFQGRGWVLLSCLLLPPPSDHFSIALLPFRHPHPQHYHYFLPFQGPPQMTWALDLCPIHQLREALTASSDAQSEPVFCLVEGKVHH